MDELPDEIHQKINSLCAEGDALASSGAYREAVEKYSEAWFIVPEPKTDWDASTWILTAIGDACFLSGNYEPGAEAFEFALRCPGSLGNPFIYLRLGQCAFEQGNEEVAAEHLCRAYAIEGKKIFSRESSKYFHYLKSKTSRGGHGAVLSPGRCAGIAME